MTVNKTYSISIFSTQNVDGQTSESKITVPCKFNFKNKLGLISYEEVIENNKFFSNIKICGPDKIIISRKGMQSVNFVFEKNKRHVCTYFTQFGNIQMGVSTHKICCSFEKNFCHINLSYSLDANNSHLSKNKVIIDVKEENNV